MPENSLNLKKAKATFQGWNTKSDGSGNTYLAGEEIVVESQDIVLYAIWKEYVKLYFEANITVGEEASLKGAVPETIESGCQT